MKYIIDGQVVLLRAPEGPLAAYIKRFAASLSEQGYASDSIHRQVLIAVGFSQWLKREEVALRSITSEHPPRYLRYRARRTRPSQGDAAALNHLLAFLRGRGRDTRREDLSSSTHPGGTVHGGVRALPAGGARPGKSNDRQLRSVHLRVSQGPLRRRTRHAVPAVCQRRRAICTAAGVAFASKASEAPDQLRCAPSCGMRAIAAKQSWIWPLRCPPWPTGRCHRYPERLRRTRSVSCWPASIGAPRWGVATTPSCSCSRDWVYVPVKWRLSNSITLTGTRDS